ncbi:mechanosensitive ion channel-like protein [Buttiauxella sp. JUb87]|uniref:mechanosensitive ion channel family protein n=1 Tax=Buttiauxella sp. JUb87 TaxID=2485129 RepID=UPI001061C3F4|nr:mechanosensitive ion channel domain-containing protein [Buttiauxella sp. JUb87]TDN51787.1 mechanosensitive ion channel-like protein [Buttiauxella sp. JUb87]
MSKALMGLCICLLLFTLQDAISAEPRQAPSPQEQARTLSLLNQPVVMLQAKFGLTTPEERVKRIVTILRSLDDKDLAQPVETHNVTRYRQPAVLFSVNGKPFMLLAQGDLDEGDDLTLAESAERVRLRLDTLRLSLSEQYSSRYLLSSSVKSLAGALVIVALIWFSLRSYAWLKRVYTVRRAQRKSIIPGELRAFLGPIEVRLYAVVLTTTILVAFYIWVSWVLRLFPWTRIWGMELGSYAIGLLQLMGLAALSALPGLVIVIVIFIITALVTRLLRLVLRRVETGQLHLPGLHPDTVGVTRKLISVVIWLFALSAAYPFLPGANSLAFKGISVFFGLMLTLGSAGLMNHAMSGLVLTYSRALRKGEVIRIADHEGVVSEVGMLATKILTRENYEVTVPNAVVVSGRIVNLSATLKGEGVNMTTSVTIGYDTPWRQVEAMLELAASRTPGINRDIPPLVRQLALQDWYVAYELQVRLKAGESLAGVRSTLHGHIQDVFNEFGVQIMSPNFISQPDQPVLVTKSNWFAPPAGEKEK